MALWWHFQLSMRHPSLSICCCWSINRNGRARRGSDYIVDRENDVPLQLQVWQAESSVHMLGHVFILKPREESSSDMMYKGILTAEAFRLPNV